MGSTARVIFGVFLLAVVILGSLFITGCSSVSAISHNPPDGGSASPTPTPTPSQSTSPVPTPTPTSTPTPVPTPVLTPTPTPTPTPLPPTSGIPRSAHVVLVIEENHTFDQVKASMPWLTSTGNSYAFSTNYHADEPGSLLDYLWLSSGSGEKSFGCSGSSCTKPITSNNIFRELIRAGVSWKVYADSLPSVGWMGGNSGSYVDRHNPAKWYSDVIDSTQFQQNMVPFTELAADMASGHLPEYSIIVPDVNHDAHNGTLAQADNWLKANVAPLLNKSYFQAGGDGLMIVTFDECDGAVGACPEQVYTAVIGPKVKRGYQSSVLYRHENALRTILDALGISSYPGAASSATDMEDFFQ